NGFGVGGPAEFPYQGAVADANQIGAAHTAIQQALPQPLCSNNPLAPKPGHAGSPFDRQGAANRFKIPDCVDYAAGGAIQDYPNVVRVINGSAMTSASFPKGLSIVSNLPVYMTGDHNKLSTQASGTSVPWISSLIAGDRVNMISNSWSDANSRWDINPSLVDRLASNTTYNTALITDSLTFFLEDWNGKTMTVNGSEVLGHNQVYSLHDNYCCGNVSYQPPTRVFNFDPHFAYITNQPPGTPTFPVSAVLIWANPE
ncbi:MAG: hypothetical protein ACXVA9_13190, partial [Bdellovibrionales bacterium]